MGASGVVARAAGATGRRPGVRCSRDSPWPARARPTPSPWPPRRTSIPVPISVVVSFVVSTETTPELLGISIPEPISSRQPRAQQEPAVQIEVAVAVAVAVAIAVAIAGKVEVEVEVEVEVKVKVKVKVANDQQS